MRSFMGKTAIAGAVVGLVVSGTTLVLLWNSGLDSRLRLVLWPASLILPPDWCCTMTGVMATMIATAINCLMYIAIALGLGEAFSRDHELTRH